MNIDSRHSRLSRLQSTRGEMLLLENLTIAEAQQEIGVLRAKLLRRDELIESLSAKKARVETTGAGVDTDEGFTLQQLQDSITEYESRFAEDEMEIHRLKGKLVFEREKVVARLSNYESQVILLEERIKKKDKEREAVDKTVEDRDAVIDEMGSEVGRLRKTIDRMEREKSCMQEQMDEAADASEELVQRIAHLEGEVAAKAGVVSDMCAARDAQLQSSGVLSLQLGDQKARYARLVAELDKLVASGSFTYSNVRREVDSSLTGGRSSRAMGGSASRRGSRASRIKLGSSARLGASTVKLASSAQLELPQSQRRPDKEVEGREAPAPTGSTASPTPQRSKAPTKPVDESAITEMLKAANEMEASAVAAAAEAIDELDKCRGELASLRDEVEASGKVYRAREANLKRQRDEATQMLNDAQNKVRELELTAALGPLPLTYDQPPAPTSPTPHRMHLPIAVPIPRPATPPDGSGDPSSPGLPADLNPSPPAEAATTTADEDPQPPLDSAEGAALAPVNAIIQQLFSAAESMDRPPGLVRHHRSHDEYAPRRRVEFAIASEPEGRNKRSMSLRTPGSLDAELEPISSLLSVSTISPSSDLSKRIVAPADTDASTPAAMVTDERSDERTDVSPLPTLGTASSTCALVINDEEDDSDESEDGHSDPQTSPVVSDGTEANNGPRVLDGKRKESRRKRAEVVIVASPKRPRKRLIDNSDEEQLKEVGTNNKYTQADLDVKQKTPGKGSLRTPVDTADSDTQTSISMEDIARLISTSAAVMASSSISSSYELGRSIPSDFLQRLNAKQRELEAAVARAADPKTSYRAIANAELKAKFSQIDTVRPDGSSFLWKDNSGAVKEADLEGAFEFDLTKFDPPPIDKTSGLSFFIGSDGIPKAKDDLREVVDISLGGTALPLHYRKGFTRSLMTSVMDDSIAAGSAQSELTRLAKSSTDASGESNDPALPLRSSLKKSPAPPPKSSALITKSTRELSFKLSSSSDKQATPTNATANTESNADGEVKVVSEVSSAAQKAEEHRIAELPSLPHSLQEIQKLSAQAPVIFESKRFSRSSKFSPSLLGFDAIRE